ncbi:MAG: aspartate/glutamate racemase family protein [Acidiferrobacterales bacterium]|nr:aspartate/glutamate racemase family protein [Acidiferrobacterales bacterium]
MSRPAIETTVDAGETRLLEHLPYEVDHGIAERAKVGLIVLATDYTIEHEWRQIFQNVPGVALYQSRILNEDVVTPETLRAMEPRITACTEVITPGTPLDVVAYGCTSASMAIGEERVFDHIRKAEPEAACTTPITAAFAAFEAFKAKRIGVLTPYSADVNRIVAKYIADRGYVVPVFGSFNEERDSIVSRITPDSIERGVREIVLHAEVDAVFVSCTSVRLVEACAQLEASLGIPLTSSNHAMAWHGLRLAGVEDRLPQLGSLFDLSFGES